MAPADQSTKGMAAADATIRDLALNAAAAQLGDMPRAKSAFDLLMMVSSRQIGSVRTSQIKAGADGLTYKMVDLLSGFPMIFIQNICVHVSHHARRESP
jgi:hypothetical protein